MVCQFFTHTHKHTINPSIRFSPRSVESPVESLPVCSFDGIVQRVPLIPQRLPQHIQTHITLRYSPQDQIVHPLCDTLRRIQRLHDMRRGETAVHATVMSTSCLEVQILESFTEPVHGGAVEWSTCGSTVPTFRRVQRADEGSRR